jgi:hypothetical protein
LELCNGINEDCDGWTDEGCPPSGANTSAAISAAIQESINIVDLGLSAYPNPANGIFTLQVQGDARHGKVTVRVMNHLGMIKEIRTGLEAGQNIKLGTDYPAGLYFIEARQGSKSKVIKVVKL